MKPAAHAAAAIAVLDQILSGEPAEKALTNWGRASRFAGSGDRAAVRDLVFGALRRKLSAAARGGGLSGRGLVLGLCRDAGKEALFSGEGHAPAPPSAKEAGRLPGPEEELDMPAWLVPELRRSLGDDFLPVVRAMRQRAPVFLRVNLAKGSPTQAISALAEDEIVAKPHDVAATALEVIGNARKVQASQAYLTGLVELQDAASQAVIEALPLSDGMKVLDYCAGGGGKALAMAARAKLKLFAHDISARRLADIPPRAKRAGAMITLIAQPEANAPFDLVLVDAPCSGSGSWRRDPEGKWRLTPERLQDLRTTQETILKQAATLVATDGWLAYVTCSMLQIENRDQIASFLSKNPGWMLQRELSLTPLTGADGFFFSLLRR